MKRFSIGVVTILLTSLHYGLAGEGSADDETPAADNASRESNGEEPETIETGKMKDIVVTASRQKTLLSNTTEVMQVVTREEIEELNPATVGELLEYTTGIDVKTGTGSGFPNRSVIGLNGLPPNRTLVLIDGVRLLSEHVHTGRNIEHIPPDSIERIEIMRGAAAAQYGGDAIGGVVNIILRKCGDKPEGSVSAAAGNDDTYKGGIRWFQPVGERWRLSVIAGREQSHGRDIEAPAHRVERMGFEENNLLTRIEYRFSEDSQVYTWLNWADNKMDWFEAEEDGYLLTTATGWDQQLCSSMKLHGRFAFSVWDSDVANERHELFQPELWLSWDGLDDHTIMGGIDYKYREFMRNAVDSAQTQSISGAFIKDDWAVTDELTLSGALRADRVQDIETVFSPKVSMLWAPDLPLRIRGSISRGFHAPTPQELSEVAAGHGGPHLRFGNRNLDPEYSTTYGLGIELFPGERFEVMLYNYYSEIEDMIVPLYEGPWAVNPRKNVWRRHNVDEVGVYGTEIELRYRISKHLRIEGGYTYTCQKASNQDQQLPYEPGSNFYVKAVAQANITDDLRCRGYVGLKGEFQRTAWSWKPGTTGPTTELDDYQNLSAGISFDYRDSMEVYCNVHNILGHEIEALDDVLLRYDGEPTYEVGMRYRW